MDSNVFPFVSRTKWYTKGMEIVAAKAYSEYAPDRLQRDSDGNDTVTNQFASH